MQDSVCDVRNQDIEELNMDESIAIYNQLGDSHGRQVSRL